MNIPVVFALLLAVGLGLILSSLLNTRSVSFADRVASQLRGETLRASRAEPDGSSLGFLRAVATFAFCDLERLIIERWFGARSPAPGRVFSESECFPS